MNIQVSASTGAKYVQYVFGEGTSGSLSGGNVRIYLGYSAASDWQRFERNVEADFGAYAGGGATWTNTDGLYITWPQATPLSYAFYIDDIRLSDSLTVEHNTLGPGSIGHILRHTTWDATTLARTDRWFHYDQVGSVMNETNAAGTLTTTHHMDAFGNVQVTWDGGLWDAGEEGWGFGSRGRDVEVDTMFFVQRWFIQEMGLFASSERIVALHHYVPYRWGPENVVSSSDPDGFAAFDLKKWDQSISRCMKDSKCGGGGGGGGDGNCCDFVRCVIDDYYATGHGTMNQEPDVHSTGFPYPGGTVVSNTVKFGRQCLSGDDTGAGHIAILDSRGKNCECTQKAGVDGQFHKTVRCGQRSWAPALGGDVHVF